MGNYLKPDTKSVTWKPKVKILQIIAIKTHQKNIPNNIRIHVPMKGCVSFVSELKTTCISHLDLHFIHIEQYHLPNMKIRQIQNFILICAIMPEKSSFTTVKQARLCLSRKTLNKIE